MTSIDWLTQTSISSASPYLLNPVTFCRALVENEYKHSVDGARAVFETESLLETASLLHTVKKERELIEEVIDEIKPNDVFYDIGANLGVFTCLVASVLNGGYVVAFEPHPGNVSRLRRNIQRNGSDVVVYECALSDKEGTAELAIEASNQRHRLAHSDDGETVTIETCRADRLVERGEKQPSVVKIDVEGAEVSVLKGMRNLLASDLCRLVYCEVHPDLMAKRNKSPGDVVSILHNAGFETKIADETGGQKYVRAQKKA